MEEKQKDNELYKFLFGGEGKEYWDWILFCRLYEYDPSIKLRMVVGVES